MGKEAVFTMKLEPELRDAFMAAAKSADRPASQIVREMMRDFVQRDRDYVEFMRRKVEAGLASLRTEPTFSTEEIEADIDALFEELERQAPPRTP